MKNIFLVFGLLLILITFQGTAAASEVVVSGSAQFDSSLSSKYMEKHGYLFIEESYYQNYLSTNMYGAKGAEVVVLNEEGKVLGKGAADVKGEFSIAVPREDSYKIVARFHGQKTEKAVKLKDVERLIVYVGYFKSDTVDVWIAKAHSRD